MHDRLSVAIVAVHFGSVALSGRCMIIVYVAQEGEREREKELWESTKVASTYHKVEKLLQLVSKKLYAHSTIIYSKHLE